MYRESDSVRRATEVAPICMLRSPVKRNKKFGGSKVALMWPKHGRKEERKTSNGVGRREEKRVEWSMWVMP